MEKKTITSTGNPTKITDSYLSVKWDYQFEGKKWITKTRIVEWNLDDNLCTGSNNQGDHFHTHPSDNKVKLYIRITSSKENEQSRSFGFSRLDCLHWTSRSCPSLDVSERYVSWVKESERSRKEKITAYWQRALLTRGLPSFSSLPLSLSTTRKEKLIHRPLSFTLILLISFPRVRSRSPSNDGTAIRTLLLSWYIYIYIYIWSIIDTYIYISLIARSSRTLKIFFLIRLDSSYISNLIKKWGGIA